MLIVCYCAVSVFHTTSYFRSRVYINWQSLNFSLPAVFSLSDAASFQGQSGEKAKWTKTAASENSVVPHQHT